MPRKTKAERQKARAKQKKKAANIQKTKAAVISSAPDDESVYYFSPDGSASEMALQDLEDCETAPTILDKLEPELVAQLDRTDFENIEPVCADAARLQVDDSLPRSEYIEELDGLTFAFMDTYFEKYRQDRKADFEKWQSKELRETMKEAFWSSPELRDKFGV
ncbi:hypothetical protein [Endozoicomonas lisbonensis]|uniref:hypothetical protein n=1 Tax=Endozoicomonas lisbonensis TaxID=3120522 RepID=UPI00339B7C11